ncbi:MAG: hypothetical protein A3G34_00655 [Candidatus Lindowbacteria bacterium RIFCSPLOWO2_12_FULL_62_27]|nr:MAG: hypothetical protein A3G34_00655 [Candidatus Lindowbacteria bacterium RIFCSPLOWO2_12_FULL_62_27]OGH58178.1 MAG: hypothetical protein A3I06_00895 [Candidatus Lindowbacteria bacterium RIFCSPLOWO2_02_FULL_62_12]
MPPAEFRNILLARLAQPSDRNVTLYFTFLTFLGTESDTVMQSYARNAVISDPADDAARTYLIDYSIHAGKFDEADYECRQWMARKPLDYRPLLSIAMVRRLRRNFKDAIGMAESALKAHESWRASADYVERAGYDADIKKIWQELAFCHESAGDLDRAVLYHKKIFDFSLEENNRTVDPSVYISLMEIYIRAKRYADAREFDRLAGRYRVFENLPGTNLRILEESLAEDLTSALNKLIYVRILRINHPPARAADLARKFAAEDPVFAAVWSDPGERP